MSFDGVFAAGFELDEGPDDCASRRTGAAKMNAPVTTRFVTDTRLMDTPKRRKKFRNCMRGDQVCVDG
jgi:hypothetical protein